MSVVVGGTKAVESTRESVRVVERWRTGGRRIAGMMVLDRAETSGKKGRALVVEGKGVQAGDRGRMGQGSYEVKMRVL